MGMASTGAALAADRPRAHALRTRPLVDRIARRPARLVAGAGRFTAAGPFRSAVRDAQRRT